MIRVQRTSECPFCAELGLTERVYWVALRELVELGVNSTKAIQPEHLLHLYGPDHEVWTCFACAEWGLL